MVNIQSLPGVDHVHSPDDCISVPGPYPHNLIRQDLIRPLANYGMVARKWNRRNRRTQLNVAESPQLRVGLPGHTYIRRTK